MTIDIDIDENVILPAYRHLLHDADRHTIEFLYGGRDSGKSYTIAELLLIECMSLPYFRCALIREQFGDIKDSQWQLIRDIVNDWGLSSLFSFTKAPLEITCKVNGNKFIARGCNEPQNLKSITACNRAWIEEGVKERASFTVILTTVRSSESKVKIYYSFNPETEGNYQNFWLWQDWFSTVSPNTLSFEDTKEYEILVRGIKKKVALNYRVTHTTYADNPFVSDERIAFHENNKGYYYTVYTLGRWGYKVTGGEFWTDFDAAKHTRKVQRIEKLPIHVALDNNLNPYVTQSVWQVDYEEMSLNQIGEVICASPHNSAKKAALRFIKWLESIDYDDVIFVHGDPSANAKTTVDDNNRSFFDKYIETLEEYGYHVINMVQPSHPRVAMSADFINEIYEKNYAGWSIVIDSDCQISIEDYTMTKKDSNGNVLKTKIKNKETGQTYEQYGHLSDAKRYFITTTLSTEFQNYADRSRRKISYV